MLARRSHAQEQAVGLVIKRDRNVLLDSWHGPSCEYGVRVTIEHHDLALFGHQNEHSPAASLGNAAAGMRIGGERSDLAQARSVKNRKVAANLASVAAAGADINLVSYWIVANRVGAE